MNLNHVLTQAKLRAARTAAKAYARRCSWTSVDDLESEAWEGILRAPPFDPTRASPLSAKLQATLTPEERTARQAHSFYLAVGIRWLSSKVAAKLSPVTGASEHSRHQLHGHVVVPLFDASGADARELDLRLSTEPEVESLIEWQDRAAINREVCERLAQLMGEGRESEIAVAFLLRDHEDVSAADVAQTFGTTPQRVYRIAEKAKTRIARDPRMMHLRARMLGER